MEIFGLHNCHNLAIIDGKSAGDFNDVSWSAFHSSRHEIEISNATLSILLPLFCDDSKSPAMIRHYMDVIKKPFK